MKQHTLRSIQDLPKDEKQSLLNEMFELGIKTTGGQFKRIGVYIPDNMEVEEDERFKFMDEHQLFDFFGPSERVSARGEKYSTNDFEESAGALVDTVERRIVIDLGNYTTYYPTEGSMPSDDDIEMLEGLLNNEK